MPPPGSGEKANRISLPSERRSSWGNTAQTAGGKTNAPVAQRVFWCTFEGLVAATLLLVGGSSALTALQAMAVSTGFPFTIVLLLLCLSLLIGLLKVKRSK